MISRRAVFSNAVCMAVAVVAIVAGGVGAQEGGSFTDPRDKKTYRTVRIGNRTWMAKNLNYQTKDSWCYGNQNSNCAKYGRLYTWDAAMSACPAGWRLPVEADLGDFIQAVGGSYEGVIWNGAGIKLKSKTGWNNNGNGTDNFGFSALPGGRRNPVRNAFENVGSDGYWWSAFEITAELAIPLNMGGDIEVVITIPAPKKTGNSVRCVQTPSGASTNSGFDGSVDQLTGGRSQTSITRVVTQNLPALRHAYNRRLRDKPDLQGRITVKFAINEFGNVIFAQVVESTMADSELESTVVSRVKSWNFDKIDKPGDVTEVTYPFEFSE